MSTSCSKETTPAAYSAVHCPTLYPASAPLAPLLAQWADSALFWTVIPYAMQPAGAAAIFAGVPPEGLKAFAADRAPFSAGIVRRTAYPGYPLRVDYDLTESGRQLVPLIDALGDWWVHTADSRHRVTQQNIGTAAQSPIRVTSSTSAGRS